MSNCLWSSIMGDSMYSYIVHGYIEVNTFTLKLAVLYLHSCLSHHQVLISKTLTEVTEVTILHFA